MSADARIKELNLELPPAPKPAGVYKPLVVTGKWAYVSGHGPQRADGAIAGPFGRVGAEVSAEQAEEAARLAALAMLGSLKRELGDLDRIAAWLRIDGYVLAAPDFNRTTNVLNGCSDLLLDVFGPELGRHARTALGVAATPLSCPVIVAAEIAIRA